MLPMSLVNLIICIKDVNGLFFGKWPEFSTVFIIIMKLKLFKGHSKRSTFSFGSSEVVDFILKRSLFQQKYNIYRW